MSNKKRSLGKGLNELLSAALAPPRVNARESDITVVEEIPTDKTKGERLHNLPLDKLIPGAFQPRQHIVHEGLEQLAESIRAQGILQPIVVRKKDDKYEIIAGERRWRAARLAELPFVPALVREVPDEAAMAMALIENIQRENLNPIEEAAAMKRLCDELELTHLQLAEALGKSRTGVTNTLRLLSLNQEVQTLLEQGQIEMGHARALLALKSDLQEEVAKTIIEKGLSVRETERLINKMLENSSFAQSPTASIVDPNIRRLEEELAEKLGAKVAIRHHRTGKGMVVIRYHDLDELDGILGHMK